MTATSTAHPAAPTSASSDHAEVGHAGDGERDPDRRRRWRGATPGEIHRAPARSSPLERGIEFPRKGDDRCARSPTTIRGLRSTRPLLASGRKKSRACANLSTVRSASHWPLWPAVAALVIGIGVIAGFELVRQRAAGAALAIGADAGGLRRAGDAAPRARSCQSAQTLALRDSLTGLPNRALLDDRIEQALARSRRTQEPFALLVVDLDGFKGVNDVRGHEAGNQVLRTIARRLESVVRATDTVARVGGDEFVVLSLGTAEDEEAAALVGRMRQALRRPYSVEGGLVEIDASIGWALFPQDGLEPADLLAQADGQMYATKRDTSEESAVPSARRSTRRRPRSRERARARPGRRPLPADRRPPAPEAVRAAEALVRREHPRPARRAVGVHPARRADAARSLADARRGGRRAPRVSRNGMRSATTSTSLSTSRTG